MPVGVAGVSSKRVVAIHVFSAWTLLFDMAKDERRRYSIQPSSSAPDQHAAPFRRIDSIHSD